MRIFALDPGTVQTGYCDFDIGAKRVLACGVMPNAEMLSVIRQSHGSEFALAIEEIESMGQAVGKETFETVHWCGRYYEAWQSRFDNIIRVTRRAVKMHLCGATAKIKDAHIRQRLIDLIGPPGTKKNPGPTYGVTSHAWAALAVAVTAAGIDDIKRAA